MREFGKKACRGYTREGNWDTPCKKKPTVERKGKSYCWQHDPNRVPYQKDYVPQKQTPEPEIKQGVALFKIVFVEDQHP